MAPTWRRVCSRSGRFRVWPAPAGGRRKFEASPTTSCSGEASARSPATTSPVAIPTRACSRSGAGSAATASGGRLAALSADTMADLNRLLPTTWSRGREPENHLQFTRGKKKEPAKGPAGSSFRESSVAGGTCDAGSFKRITASSSQDGVNAAHAYEDSSSLSMAFEADDAPLRGRAELSERATKFVSPPRLRDAGARRGSDASTDKS